MVIVRGWWEENMGSQGSLGTFSVWEDVEALEMDCGDGCTTMQMYLETLNRTLQNG